MTDFQWEMPRIFTRLKPEVRHALGVILSAIFEEPVAPARAAEEARHTQAQRERIRRAERGARTRRRNAKKKKKGLGGVKKKRPVKPDGDGVSKSRCRAVSFTGERCTRPESHPGKHEAKSGHWLSPIRHRCHYQIARRRCLLLQGHAGEHALEERLATKGSKRK